MLNSRKATAKNFGSFLNIKGIENGKNVPFRAIRDILKHKKEVSQMKETVGVSIIMLFNGEMYDLFTE